MLTGDNGILQRATAARDNTIVGQEKEIVSIAYNSALTKKIGNGDSTAVTSGELNTELANQGASADGSNPIIVIFSETNNKYNVYNNGKIEEKKPLNLPNGLTIGSIVKYEPTGSTYEWKATYCSAPASQERDDVVLDSTNVGSYRITNWQVFKIDTNSETIQLVPETTAGTVYLGQASGYNNGVKLLNDACAKLYSDINNNITARSINIEDIEVLIDESILQEAKAGVNVQTDDIYTSTKRTYPKKISINVWAGI